VIRARLNPPIAVLFAKITLPSVIFPVGTRQGALDILDHEILHVMLVLLDFVRVLEHFLELEAESPSELKKRVSS
jgi:hypothetical protein